MSIKKLDDGRYEVDVRPQGSEGKRIRRKFDSKGEAQIFERHTLVNYHNKDWLEKPADKRKLTDLLELWWVYHGKSHEYGETSKGRLNTIISKLAEVGVTRSDQLTKKAITNYRVQMLNEGLKASSINRHQSLLSGMFSKLIEVEEFHSEHPFRGVKKFKEPVVEMGFLSQEEIGRLLDLLDGDNRKAVLVCLATGGRWGEVASLKGEHIINNMVTFMKTKNGKPRTIPVSAGLISLIKIRATGTLFKPDYKDVRDILRKMKPDLPAG